MRKEIGQQVRQLLFSNLSRALPGFVPSRDGGIPGHYWVFTRADAAPTVWYLGYQQHRHEDWFTLEIAWSRDGGSLDKCAMAEPQEYSSTTSGRFRVARLWTTEDYWWQLAPVTHPASDLHDVARWLSRVPVSVHEASSSVPVVVEDAVSKLQEHLAPWISVRSGASHA